MYIEGVKEGKLAFICYLQNKRNIFIPTVMKCIFFTIAFTLK